MIKAEELIEKFRYVLDNHWGYIFGAAGIMWTEAKQKQKVDYMVNKYGTSWQKNSEAKQDNYYMSALYGSKWIGHYVADCSGLFSWAYAKLGGTIAHGSNSIYDRYCSKKGKLNSSLKNTLLPGTAVFTGTEKAHGHIGLYVGNGKVIEAQGTQAGVCTSNLSAGKWTYYGELSAVDYNNKSEQTTDTYYLVKKGSKGEAVKTVQTMLMKLGYNLGSWGVDGDFGSATERAVKEFQRDHNLTQDGIVGNKTYAALTDAVNKLSDSAPAKKYSIAIHGLTKAQADEIKKQYPGATVTEE